MTRRQFEDICQPNMLKFSPSRVPSRWAEESVGGDVDVQHDRAPLNRHLRIHRYRGHLVLEFHGEIDVLAAFEITPFLDSATGRPTPRIVIDLRPVEFFDCSGLRLLYRARRRVL